MTELAMQKALLFASFFFFNKRDCSVQERTVHVHMHSKVVCSRLQFHKIQIPLAVNLMIDHTRVREPFQFLSLIHI